MRPFHLSLRIPPDALTTWLGPASMGSIAAGVETLRTTSSSGAQDLLGFGGAVINGLEGVSGDEQGEISLEAM